MFGTRDLLTRLAAAAMTSRAGYRLTRRLTPRISGDRRRWIGSQVEAAALGLLGDPALAAAAGARFAIEMACDDLDAVTAAWWPEPRRLASVKVEGGEHLPARGPAVVVSFHVSGGFRVFDVLRARGLAPTFLWAPPREAPSRYLGTIQRLRLRHLRRSAAEPSLASGASRASRASSASSASSASRASPASPASSAVPPFVSPGPGAREQLDRHLDRGGVVVALLDVSPASLDLRDHTACRLFARPLELPVGLLRLALRYGAPVIPYAGRLEDDRRVIRFHPHARGESVETLLSSVLATFEDVIRVEPGAWQAWLELDTLFPAIPGAPAALATPPEDRTRHVKSFDRVADCYDATRALPPEAQSAVTTGILRAVRDVSRETPPRVLEIGIGTGRIAVPLAEAGVHVVGIDVARAMIARLHAKRRDVPVALALAGELPFRAHVFDAALFVHILHLVDDPIAVLRAASRAVRPGGVLLYGRTAYSESPRRRILARVRELVHELAGVDVAAREPHAVADAAFREHALAVGARLEETPLARWQEHGTGRDALEAIAKRTHSNTWGIPDAILPELMQRLTPWTEQVLGDLDRPMENEGAFTLVAARLPE